MPEKNEKQLEAMESVRWVEREKNYGGEELWNYGNDKNYYTVGVNNLQAYIDVNWRFALKMGIYVSRFSVNIFKGIGWG